MLRAIEHTQPSGHRADEDAEHRDINQHRLAKFKERIRETMMGEELEIYHNLGTS